MSRTKELIADEGWEESFDHAWPPADMTERDFDEMALRALAETQRDQLEVCNSCILVDAELEWHGDVALVTCSCGNYGPVERSAEAAIAGWNLQNVMSRQRVA